MADFDRLPGVVALGDWVVDEHWIVGDHRPRTASRTGPRHTRALHGKNATLLSLSGAGKVASVLAQAVTSVAESGAPRTPALRVYGVGRWHADDTDALTDLLDPVNGEGITPHRLTPVAQGSGRRVEDKKLWNVGGDSTGTCRVVREYIRSGRTFAMTDRIDWELRAEEPDREVCHRELLALKDATDEAGGVEHIVLKDLGKGTVCAGFIQAATKVFPEARWHISSKRWQPEWTAELPRDRVETFFVPTWSAREAASHSSFGSSFWITEGHPTSGALSAVEELQSQYRNATIIVMPSGMSMIARAPGALNILVQTELGDTRMHEFWQLASIVFPALLAHRIGMEARGRPTTLQCSLQRSLDYLRQWQGVEYPRFNGEPNWSPQKQEFIIE